MTTGPEGIDFLEPFMRHLGVTGIRFSEAGGEVELELEAHHMNRFDTAHGGVIMTVLDFAMAQTCRVADESRRPAITVEIKTAFLRPGTGTLRCTARCLHRSGSMAFGEGRVVDQSGALVAYGSGTFKYTNA